jgi:hypothetical protein
MTVIQWTGWSGDNALDLYLAGAWLQSWPGHWLAEVSYGIPESSQANVRIVPWLSNEHFLPNHFQFTYQPMLCSLSTESIINKSRHNENNSLCLGTQLIILWFICYQ